MSAQSVPPPSSLFNRYEPFDSGRVNILGFVGTLEPFIQYLIPSPTGAVGPSGSVQLSADGLGAFTGSLDFSFVGNNVNIASPTGSFQIAGQSALSTPDGNILVGPAGNAPPSGASNVLIGGQFITPSVTTGVANVFINTVGSPNTTNCVGIGEGCATSLLANTTASIAIGELAGVGTSSNTVSIGSNCGGTQNPFAIAIGYRAGNFTQGVNAVAIGSQAGQFNQGASTIAIGSNAGNGSQQSNAVAIGIFAGQSNQSSGAIAIGFNAGSTNSGLAAVAIGEGAGVAIQGNNCVAIGLGAGRQQIGTDAVAIGTSAGNQNQSTGAVAIGVGCGASQQGLNAVAVGPTAGNSFQGPQTVAIGFAAGNAQQGTGAVAIGFSAGGFNQGANSIAIGTEAGLSNQAAGSIAINESGLSLNPTTAGCFINPVNAQTAINTNAMVYDTATNEVTYNTTKTFVIPHPVEPTQYLVHACLEGPEVGVYYRGRGEIQAGSPEVWIEMPSYVSSLAHDWTIQLSPIRSRNRPAPVALESGEVILDGLRAGFSVYGSPGCFHWLVMGSRGKLDAEVPRAKTTVSGFGPYRYLSGTK
jgi:hypothetical protein